MYYVVISIASGALAFVRILAVSKVLPSSDIAVFLSLQAVFYFAAYADLGMNQGVLHHETAAKTPSEIKSLQWILKTHFPVTFAGTVAIATMLMNSIAPKIGGGYFAALFGSYAAGFMLQNSLQIKLRLLGRFNSLARLNLMIATISLLLTIFPFMAGTNASLYYYLSTIPVATLLCCIIYALNFRPSSKENINPQVNTAESLKFFRTGFAVSISGALFTFMMSLDRILVAKKQDDLYQWTTDYLFFVVLGGLVFTAGGLMGQKFYSLLFEDDQDLGGLLVKFSMRLVFFGVIFLAASYLLIIFFYPERANNINLLPWIFATQFMFTILAFVCQAIVVRRSRQAAILTIIPVLALHYFYLQFFLFPAAEPAREVALYSMTQALVATILVVSVFKLFYRDILKFVSILLAVIATVSLGQFAL